MAALTITAGGVTANFLTARAVQGGFISRIPTIKAEVLETPGVSGRRWRNMGFQMEPATIECIADGGTWVNAMTLADTFRSMVGFFGTATMTSGGTPKTYKNVYLASIEATPVMGNVTGGGASAGSVAHVRVTIVLEATDFSNGA